MTLLTDDPAPLINFSTHPIIVLAAGGPASPTHAPALRKLRSTKIRKDEQSQR